MEKTTNVPSAQEAAAFLRDVIPQLDGLTLASMHAELYFKELFGIDWGYHYFRQLKSNRRDNRVPLFVLALNRIPDSPFPHLPLRRKLMEKLCGALVYPPIEVSEKARKLGNEYACVWCPPVTHQYFEEIERWLRPVGYETHAWQEVILHNFCVYCLEPKNYTEKTVGKKKYVCHGWTWAAWFMADIFPQYVGPAEVFDDERWEFAKKLINLK